MNPLAQIFLFIVFILLCVGMSIAIFKYGAIIEHFKKKAIKKVKKYDKRNERQRFTYVMGAVSRNLKDVDNGASIISFLTGALFLVIFALMGSRILATTLSEYPDMEGTISTVSVMLWGMPIIFVLAAIVRHYSSRWEI